MSDKSKNPATNPAAAAPLSRRTLFAGAGAVGAMAAAASALPLLKPVAPAVAAALPKAAEGGYQLTEHVERYYQTARI